MSIKTCFRGFCTALLLALPATVASATTIIVNGDEWTLSNNGFANGTGTDVFVDNLVSEFGPNLHAYSNNFGYTQSSLAAAMANAGATYTTGTGISFDLPTLLGYDGLLLGGQVMTAGEMLVLNDYVAAGGNVYLSAGTAAYGGPANEAAAWNDFLAPFGIELAPVWTGFSGTVTPDGDALFAGVDSLFIVNPNGIASGGVCCAEETVFAIYRSPTPAIPLPAAGWLLLTVFGGVGIAARRRQS